MHAMPYGKHRGRAPDEVPCDYLLWMLRNCKLSGGLRQAIRDSLLAREVDEDQLPPEPAPQAPCCRRCGGVELLLTWQALGNTESKVIRAECRGCGAFVYFAPQTPENVALADSGCAVPAPQADEVFEVRLVAPPGRVPAEVRLKKLLKTALRAHNLKCASVVAVKPDEE
jgi:hypothetical protein